jgi:hypothetical protein
MMNIALVLAFIAALLPAAKPTDYSTDMVMLTDGQVGQTLKLYVSGQKSRVEGMTAGPLGSVIAIHRRDKGLTLALYPKSMEYTEKPVSASQSSGKPDLSSLDLGAMKKENLGKETVLGYACTKMRVTFGNMPNGRPLTGTIWVADSLELPIRLDFMGIVQENRNLKIGPQPAALFEIPAGYRKTQSPGRGISSGAGVLPGGGMLSGTGTSPGAAAKSAVLSTTQSSGLSTSAVTAQNQPSGGTVGQASAGETSTIRLEADKLKIVRRTSGEARSAKFAEDGFAAPGAFTEDKVLYWHDAGDVGATLELGIPVSKKGRYGMLIHSGHYRTWGRFQFLINGNPVGAPVDFFGFPDKDEIVEFSFDLGEVQLNAGDNRLGLKLVGSNPETVMPDHGVCIDWVQLTFKGGTGTTGGTGSTGGTTGILIGGTTTTGTTGGTTGGSTGTAATLEADTLQILKCTSGEAMPRRLAEDGYANEGEFTGDRSLQWHDAGEPGALLELALPVQTKGWYTISVRAAKYRTYAIHQFLINGTPLGKPVDMFGNPGQDIVTAFTVSLGEANLDSGNNRLGIRLVGTNPNTIMANHGAGLDWIKLTPARAKP